MSKQPEKWYKVVHGATSKTVYLGTDPKAAVASMTEPRYHYIRHESDSKEGPWLYVSMIPTGKPLC
jgi:hypothetical protein